MTKTELNENIIRATERAVSASSDLVVAAKEYEQRRSQAQNELVQALGLLRSLGMMNAGDMVSDGELVETLKELAHAATMVELSDNTDENWQGVRLRLSLQNARHVLGLLENRS